MWLDCKICKLGLNCCCLAMSKLKVDEQLVNVALKFQGGLVPHRLQQAFSSVVKVKGAL